MALQTRRRWVSRELNQATYQIDATLVVKRAVSESGKGAKGRDGQAQRSLVRGKECGAAEPAASGITIMCDRTAL
jgi:hypothetical protein